MRNPGEITGDRNAEGADAINSQAEGADFDDTLESKGAPKK